MKVGKPLKTRMRNVIFHRSSMATDVTDKDDVKMLTRYPWRRRFSSRQDAITGLQAVFRPVNDCFCPTAEPVFLCVCVWGGLQTSTWANRSFNWMFADL